MDLCYSPALGIYLAIIKYGFSLEVVINKSGLSLSADNNNNVPLYIFIYLNKILYMFNNIL